MAHSKIIVQVVDIERVKYQSFKPSLPDRFLYKNFYVLREV